MKKNSNFLVFLLDFIYLLIKKTNNYIINPLKIKNCFLISLIIFPLSLYSEDIEFSASAPSSVSVGERFRITYKLNSSPSSFNASDFEGFRVLSGPMQSSSTSVQIINGKTTREESYTFSFILEAFNEGVFTIKPAEAVVDGKKYKSNAVSIEVKKSDDHSPATKAKPTPDEEIPQTDDELFVRAYVNNTNPYQGEQVIIHYKIYTRVPVTRYSVERLPSYQGFWSENLTDRDGSRQPESRIINGHRYKIAEIRRVALFPQRSGKMTIEPLEIECMVRVTERRRRESLFEEFFSTPFDRSRTVQRTIKSNKIELNVKPLPTQNQPASFTGLVGDFKMSANIDNDNVNINDAITLNVNISGNGNLRMSKAPKISFPHNLDIYDPRTTDDINLSRTGVRGSRNFEYLIIPRTDGEFEIHPIEISYFNPAKSKYITLSSDPFKFNVEETPSAKAIPGTISGREVKYIDSDIRHIYLRNISLYPAGKLFFRSPQFYLLLGLPALLFLVFILLYYRKLKNEENISYRRTKLANKAAKKHLKSALKLLKQNKDKEFFDEIFKALWGYLSNKMNIPVSELSKDNVRNKLKEKNIPGEIIDEFINTLDHCEYARFSPGDKEENMDKVYSMSLEIIVKTEKWLRKSKS